MSANEIQESRWTLLRRPRQVTMVTLACCFLLFCFLTRAHEGLDFLACGACTLGYFFLLDGYREFVYPWASRRVRSGFFFPVGLLVTIGLAEVARHLTEYFGAEPIWARLVAIVFIAAGSGALGAFFLQRKDHGKA